MSTPECAECMSQMEPFAVTIVGLGVAGAFALTAESELVVGVALALGIAPARVASAIQGMSGFIAERAVGAVAQYLCELAGRCP